MNREFVMHMMAMIKSGHGCCWTLAIGQPMLYDGGLFVNREPLSDIEYYMNVEGRIRQQEIMEE